MLIFCTLFDSKYIDKGLALYESLCKVEQEFKLYIFAFDQTAYEILSSLRMDKVILVSLEEFESEKMLEIKKTRSPAEYCWTCTPISVDYVLSVFNEPYCTYLDADLYFFFSPAVLFDEIRQSQKSVIITEHRFPQETMDISVQKSGKYCVQFNTFLNDKEGREVLREWKDNCMEWCYYTPGEEKMGDQKYLETWTSDYSCVHELQNLGGGVAPWNISQYYLADSENLILSNNQTQFQLIFYHFQNIRYLPFSLVNIRSGTKDIRLKKHIYYPYLRHIEKIRKRLWKEYGLTFSVKKSYYQNSILRFIQNYIMPFKIKSLSDIMNLRKMRKF